MKESTHHCRNCYPRFNLIGALERLDVVLPSGSWSKTVRHGWKPPAVGVPESPMSALNSAIQPDIALTRKSEVEAGKWLRSP